MYHDAYTLQVVEDEHLTNFNTVAGAVPFLLNLILDVSGWYQLISPAQNGRRLEDGISKCIFMNKKFCILIKISLKFVPKGPTDNNPALVWIMALCRIGEKTFSEPMLTQFTDAYSGEMS